MDAFAALATTWPAAETISSAGWTLRRGAGGGNRVSAATRAARDADVAVAEAGMRAWGQAPLFMIRPGEDGLDAALAARGYAMRDATALLAGPLSALASAPPGDAVVLCDAPLSCMVAIWAADGIGPGRLAVMARAPEPRVWLLGREENRPAACGFAALHGSVAMLHALAVTTDARRRGLGGLMSRTAAAWAERAGAQTLALAVARDNGPALALYGGLGLTEVGGYHYRAAPESEVLR